MTRDEFISRHRIEDVLADRGIKLGSNGVCKCPLHEDRSPSFSVNINKQIWMCHAGCGGGSVIDLMAKLEGVDPIKFIKDRGIDNPDRVKFSPPPASKPEPLDKRIDLSKPEKIYSYQDSLGNEVFQVCRYVPKTFRQRHKGSDGKWVMNMEGVERVLYRLPEVLKADTVALCEGEKDADTLVSMGFCGTCNVGGAGKWLDGYTESLAGRNVILFPDNDKPGREHAELVLESIGEAAKEVRIVTLPSGIKDVTDYVRAFENQSEALDALNEIVADTVPHYGGVKVPIYTMSDLEPRYEAHVRESEENSIELGRWLPSLRRIRRLAPGELVLLVGNTGIGKTALLSSMASAFLPTPLVMFQLELPSEMLFERFLASKTNVECDEVESAYQGGHGAGRKVLDHHFKGLFICSEPNMTVERIQQLVVKSELKIGQKPKVVFVDYAQLIDGTGKTKYEKMSSIAEDLKRMAKATRTVVVVASQIGRPNNDEKNDVKLHDAKDSGSLENSSGVVIGAWRNPNDSEELTLRILKSTKGGAGLTVTCNFIGEKMQITERHVELGHYAPQSDSD